MERRASPATWFLSASFGCLGNFAVNGVEDLTLSEVLRLAGWDRLAMFDVMKPAPGVFSWTLQAVLNQLPPELAELALHRACLVWGELGKDLVDVEVGRSADLLTPRKRNDTLIQKFDLQL